MNDRIYDIVMTELLEYINQQKPDPARGIQYAERFKDQPPFIDDAAFWFTLALLNYLTGQWGGQGTALECSNFKPDMKWDYLLNRCFLALDKGRIEEAAALCRRIEQLFEEPASKEPCQSKTTFARFGAKLSIAAEIRAGFGWRHCNQAYEQFKTAQSTLDRGDKPEWRRNNRFYLMQCAALTWRPREARQLARELMQSDEQNVGRVKLAQTFVFLPGVPLYLFMFGVKYITPHIDNLRSKFRTLHKKE